MWQESANPVAIEKPAQTSEKSDQLEITARAPIVTLRSMTLTDDQVAERSRASPWNASYWFNEAKRRDFKPSESMRFKDVYLTSKANLGRRTKRKKMIKDTPAEALKAVRRIFHVLFMHDFYHSQAVFLVVNISR